MGIIKKYEPGYQTDLPVHCKHDITRHLVNNVAGGMRKRLFELGYAAYAQAKHQCVCCNIDLAYSQINYCVKG